MTATLQSRSSRNQHLPTSATTWAQTFTGTRPSPISPGLSKRETCCCGHGGGGVGAGGAGLGGSVWTRPHPWVISGHPGGTLEAGRAFAPLPVPRRVSWGRFWARSGASTALPEEVQALQLQCPATGLALRGSSRPTWLSSTRTAKVIGVKHNCSKSDKMLNKGLHWFRRGFGRGVVHVELNALVKQIQTN